MEKISLQYDNAVQQIKQAILDSQLRAVRAVNQEQLALYFGIGKFVSENSRRGTWGTGAIESISAQLQRELPGLKGFSAASIKKMRIFYEQWQVLENRAPAANDLQSDENHVVSAENFILSLNRAPAANDLDLHDFLSIGFTHHYEILSKTKTLEERVFYIHQAAVNHWDKYYLRDMLKKDAFHHQSQMPNNFLRAIPEKHRALQAISMFKDEYILDYLNVEELDVTNWEDVDEKVVEKSIVRNVTNFIMTFGRAFSYMGHQVHYEKLNHDHWVDLLFYNRELQSLVVVELKKGAFKSSYFGQLQSYLRVLDDDERFPFENPSVGLILCREADKAYVEYVLQDYAKPMGVATYKLELQQKLMDVLPPEENMKALIVSEGEQDTTNTNE